MLLHISHIPQLNFHTTKFILSTTGDKIQSKYSLSAVCVPSPHYCKIFGWGKKKERIENFQCNQHLISLSHHCFAFIYALCVFVTERRKNFSLLNNSFFMFRETHYFPHLNICLSCHLALPHPNDLLYFLIWDGVEEKELQNRIIQQCFLQC